MSKITLNSLSVLKSSTILTLSSLWLLWFPVAGSALLAREVKQSAGGQVIQHSTVPSSFQDYHKQCLERATGQGLPGDVAKDLCNCAIKKFQSQYNFNQFRDLVVKSQKDRTAARTLTQVGETCFDQVLYE
ncbi:hypothetical protein [Gloeothece verrucosa]|uniref:Uncharacterized protein n=1 Tax=Gloeothece verrucosa (strain PCC 7822) TaxID=497965 RepID=E0UFI7_GLOV7|nr:hypothetical protein [Gloeothece verrucosa]ADN16681.1 conserved hypothetical protein [Gloeothece verrucosa PCC 7822]